MEETIKAIGEKGVQDFAKHWWKCGDKVEKLIAEQLLYYALSKEYTPQEMKAYRDGLATIPNIYNECGLYIENKNKSD